MVWLFTGRFPDGEVDGRTVKARLVAVVRELRGAANSANASSRTVPKARPHP